MVFGNSWQYTFITGKMQVIALFYEKHWYAWQCLEKIKEKYEMIIHCSNSFITIKNVINYLLQRFSILSCLERKQIHWILALRIYESILDKLYMFVFPPWSKRSFWITTQRRHQTMPAGILVIMQNKSVWFRLFIGV